MKYDECKPLEGRLASVWRLRLPGGAEKLLVLSHEFTFEEVHNMCLNHFPQGFQLGIFGVGEVTVVDYRFQNDDVAWCPDSRFFDQDLNCVGIDDQKNVVPLGGGILDLLERAADALDAEQQTDDRERVDVLTDLRDTIANLRRPPQAPAQN